MCQFEHSEIKCIVIVIWLFTFGKRKDMKTCNTILELLHRTKYFVWKNPKKVIFEKPTMIQNTSHIHCHLPRNRSLD
jgi:hypothetical protein